MNTLTKKDLVRNLAKDHGFNNKIAKEFVDAFFDEMSSALENGFDVKLDGFGNFTLANKKERMALNPRTKEKSVVTARRVTVFKSGRKMKDYVQSQRESAQKSESYPT